MSNLPDLQAEIQKKLDTLEAEMQKLRRQLTSSQKLATVGTMAGILAHEFNNILTPVMNYAQLALNRKEDLQLSEKALQKALSGSQRAALICERLLGLVREDDQIRSLPLAELVDQTIGAMGRDLTKDSIDLICNINPAINVRGQTDQIQQVLLNLIINSRQSMLETGGTLRIEAAADQSFNVVHVSVIDTGCGIAAENMDKLFQPFFSTKINAERQDQQGTGLGLTICKQIIEDHGGTVEASSQLGKGTCITFTLPRNDKKLAAAC